MTFTTNDMQQARYTTRTASLDTIGVQCDLSADCLANAIQAPADGLSISEAMQIGKALESRLRALDNLRRYIHGLRSIE